MNDKPTESQDRPATESGTEALVRGMAGVVNAALGVGAAMAKATAEATAFGQPVPPPPDDGQSPVNVMVHYGVSAVINVVGAVARGVGNSRPASMASTAPPPPQAAGDRPEANLPTVHCGATLRIPLSIENQGPTPMPEMRFACLEVSGGDPTLGELLMREAFRFEPELLSVGPRDFEKLTVYVDIPETAAPGPYQATIAPAEGEFEIVLRLMVLPAEAGSP